MEDTRVTGALQLLQEAGCMDIVREEVFAHTRLARRAASGMAVPYQARRSLPVACVGQVNPQASKANGYVGKLGFGSVLVSGTMGW
ncbi:hypothetical protein NDU88_005410 [Pleurodeles waltl]|uniref:Uncharacterized protein n=1 Tax=Pleurodeles waltl TaxID=8319 RepID=A0AAV7VIX2_PLEWA|nr:hypothetical protein NDU88_005410 [Pleurodeles waltl]